MKNSLEYSFARFVHILRHLGIKVSTEEALACIDILNRDHVRAALRATLVKNYDEQSLFERAFESFFATPERRREQQRALEELRAQEARLLEEAEKDLVYQGVKLDLTEEEKLFYAQLPEEEKERIRQYLEASYLPEDRWGRFKPTLEYYIRGSLRYWRQLLGEEEPFRLPGGEGYEVLAAVIREFGSGAEDILYEDMKRIAERDLPRVTNILKKLSRKLATRIARRYRTSRKVARVDLRRSIRSNVRYGGIIFKLKYKQKRVQKPRLVLICDVSGSMARYAAFVIQFIYGLSAAVRQIESFIFAEELEYVTPFFRRLRPFEETMSKLIAKSRVWGKGTNFGASLEALFARYPHLLTSHTVALIVSDTKTLEIERAERQLALLKKSVKEVIWLNTLPRAEWDELRSVATLRRHCQMFECYTLAHLERIIRRQFLA